jgi:O-glycosyl hydrolase
MKNNIKSRGRYLMGLLTGILLLMSGSSLIFGATAVTVSPNIQYQTLEGWGTSLCWWGNVVGGYSDTARNAIVDLIFNSGSGLGMNIVRYNIGGGENPSHNHMGAGKEMEGFKPTETGAYDWTKDANQRWILSAAKSRIASNEFIAEAFSNSPPYWMTNSGCASGASGGGNNLKSNYYTAFADYLTEVVKHFRDSWGITFRTLEGMNEPMGSWSVNGSQEGCHFDRSLEPNVIREIKAKLDSKGLTGTKISAPDEYSIDNTVGSYSSYDSTIRSYIYQINTHIYSGSQRSQLRTLATNEGKKLWDSEADGSGAANPFDVWTHNHNDIVPALDIANRITKDMREMKPEGWIFWQAVESEQGQISLNKNWGMIHADFNGGQNYYITKKYYGVEQYTKFIRPGNKMIDINQAEAVAFMDLSQGRLVIVQRNASTNSVTYDYNLYGFSAVGASAAVYRTSSSENFAQKSDIPITNKILSATANAQSITTYVIYGISYGGNSTPTPTQRVTPTPTSRQTPTPTRRVTPTPTRRATPTPTQRRGTTISVNDNTTGTGTNQFEYVGSWSYGSQTGAYQNDNHWEGDTNGYYQVRFNGTQIKVYAAKAPNHGIAAFSIDGGAETNVDFYVSSRQEQALVYSSPGLAAGAHILKVRVTGTKNSRSSGVYIPADRVDITN